MFPKSVTQASTSFSDIDLVTCLALDSINHIIADTGVFRLAHKSGHAGFCNPSVDLM